MRGSRRVKARGFSFIELNLVAAILAVLALVTYATFSQGLKVWQRVNVTSPEVGVHIFFDQLSMDLRNAVSFKLIPIAGVSAKFQFPVLSRNSSRSNGECGFGEVVYTFTPAAGTISRRYRDFKMIPSNIRSSEETSLADHIQSCTFLYDYRQGAKLGWHTAIDAFFPLALKAQVIYTHNGRIVSLYKVISVPMADRDKI